MIFEKLRNTYTREIENKPLNSFGFYTLLLLVISGTTALAGIWPLLERYYYNKSHYEELQNVNNMMLMKIKDVNEGKSNLDNLANEIEKLDGGLPDDLELENFLQEFVFVTAQNGYTINYMEHEGLRKGDVEQLAEVRSINILTEIIGPLYSLPKLLNDMENMDRLNNIVEIFTTNGDEESQGILLRGAIYSLYGKL